MSGKSSRTVAVLAHYHSHGRQKPRSYPASGWGAHSIATVPLDQFSREGAAAVITSFALWGLSQLLLSVVMVLVSVRYRGLIPVTYVLILMEYLGRIAIGLSKPLPTLTTPPGAAGNLVFIAAAVSGLALCFREARS